MTNEMEVFWHIRRIDARFRRIYHAVAEQEGEQRAPDHGHGHGKILRTLAHSDGMTQKELAERLDIRPQSLTDALVRLEQDGSITRTRSERDKREQLVRITEAGRVRSQKLLQLHEKAAQMALSGLDEAQKQKLSELLRLMIDGEMEETSGV